MAQSLVFQIVHILGEIIDFLQHHGCEEKVEAIKALLQRGERKEFHLAVVGGYNRGKSTLINALLGEEVLPTANQPTTKLITYIRASKNLAVRLGKDEDKVTRCNDTQELHDHLIRTSSIGKVNQEITVDYPFFLGKGVILVDTPGQ